MKRTMQAPSDGVTVMETVGGHLMVTTYETRMEAIFHLIAAAVERIVLREIRRDRAERKEVGE